MPMIGRYWGLILSVFLAMPVLAEGLSAKGMATVTFSSKFTPEIQQEALQKAKANALDRYFAETHTAKAKNYDLIRAKLLADIDAYVLGVTILSEETDKKGGNYAIVVRADLNAARIENVLQDSSAMANATASEKSLLTFIFVARQQKSVQSFDDKIYKRVDGQVTENESGKARRRTAESERVGRSGVETADAVETSVNFSNSGSAIVTTGGSTTRKADIVEWDVTRAGDINSIMTGTFSSAGYEVVEADYLEHESDGRLNIEAIRGDYSRGDDLAPATMRGLVEGVRSANVPYVALGTLDVGIRDTDPATGLVRVYVTVSAKALNVTGRFPKTLSSVGPVQFAGLGPSESVARTNALKEAAQNAAQQLMNEMNAKGVQ